MHEAFDFHAYDAGAYDETPRIGMDRESWQSMPDIGLVPLYLHYVGVFDADAIIERADGVVTAEPVFEIFDKKDLTLAEMIREIWQRRKEIVRISPGTGNPYEDT